jgi:Icc protein
MVEREMDLPVRVVQITDTHLFRDPRAALLKLNTQDSFEKVMELVIQNESDIDVVLGTGDIAQDASREAYLRFAQAMQPLNAPFYWIPGNHDHRQVMETLEPFEHAFANLVTLGKWQIVLLDSSVAGEVYGRLHERELQHLERTLQAVARHLEVEHVLVCLHHNPVDGTAGWMSGIGLHNQDEFLAIIERHACVRAVLYGHIHQELDFVRQGVRYLCTPSTCIQFKPQVQDFTLDDVNPAYRTLLLQPDGRIDTHVIRVTGHAFEVDHTSTGY